jgi:hypothetical protein
VFCFALSGNAVKDFLPCFSAFATPKALHLKAQGRERSERTLGNAAAWQMYAEGVPSTVWRA